MRQAFVFISILLAFVSIQEAGAEVCKGPSAGIEGQCAPDFELKDLKGNTVQLSDYRGKVVFLNFWATWCAPCIDEIPSMEALNEAMQGKDFAMLAVSIDSEGKSEIERFFRDKLPNQSYSFKIPLDELQQVSRNYGTFKVPETFIIDKTGKIRDKIIGPENWNKGLIVHYLELLAKE